MANRSLNNSTSPLSASGIVGSSMVLADWLEAIDILSEATDFPASRKYGAKANGKKLTDAIILSGSLNTVRSAKATFSSADVGKVIQIQSAGASNGKTAFNSIELMNNAHKTTIATFVDANTVTLTAAAINTVSGVDAVYGTDDIAAIQKACDSALVRGSAVVDGGGHTYLVSDTASLSYGNQTFRNFKLLMVDTDATTYNGASTFNYSQVSAISLNNGRFGAAYTGPAYPNGKPVVNSYWTGTDDDWAYNFRVLNNVIDCSCVTTGYPGQIPGGRPIGDSVIGGSYIGNVRVENNTIISAQTGGISMRACFDAIAANNTIDGFRCTLFVASGDVWGGNGIQMFTAYPGVVDSYTVNSGANKILNNTVIGAAQSVPFPGRFVNSAQNALLTCNIGIDIQSGGRPTGTPQLRQPLTAYNVNDRRSNSNLTYVCTVAGTSGSGNGPTASSGNANITDGSVTWVLALSGTQWSPSSAGSIKTITVGQRCNNNGNTYIATQGGQTTFSQPGGEAIPAGPTGTGTGIVDNGVIWDFCFGGPNWTQNTPFNAGQKIYNGIYWFTCITPGTSAASGQGPVGNGNFVLDGTVVWATAKSYMRPMPQSLVMGNHVRRCGFGIMAEGQRSGGAGDMIVSNNDVIECLQGISFYTDQIDLNTMSPYDSGYSVIVSHNRVANCYVTSIFANGTAFLIEGNMITDWGIYSGNLHALGYLSTLSVISKAIVVAPLTAASFVSAYQGSIKNNECVMHSAFDPVTNFFTHGGIAASTQFDNQIWRYLSIKGNTIDFGSNIKKPPASWVASTLYSQPSTYVTSSGNTYRLVTPGTSGSTTLAGTSLTATITDGSCVWQFVQANPSYGPNNAAISLYGMIEDAAVHDNMIARSPHVSLVTGPRRSLATMNMAPARLSVKNNTIHDPAQAAAAGAGQVFQFNVNGRSGYVIEGNSVTDTGGKVGYSMIFPPEVTGVDNSVSDVSIRFNRTKGGTLDQTTIRVNIIGTNIRIEQNDPFNYVPAIPNLTSTYAGMNLYAGTAFMSTAPIGGSALGWVVMQTGRVSATNWAASTVQTLNTYVNNGANVYRCTVAGTSASSGGPTGTGASITDSGATWAYVSPIPTLAPIAILEPAPATAVSAAGTTQGDATQLVKGITKVTTAAAASGVKLPLNPAVNDTMFLLNAGANAVTLYPALSATVNVHAVNVGISIPVGTAIMAKAISATEWLVNF